MVAIALTLLLALTGARASAGILTWVEDDWSNGAYTSTQGIDADIEPGLLALTNHPEDMRFVAEPTAYQGIYTIAAYNDTLFLGASPYPIMGNGADILSYDYASDTFALDYSLYEQGVTALKVYGDTLYAPGPDSQGSWLWGNVYLRDRSGWTRKETVPSAVHLFDIAVEGGSIYTAGGDRFSNGAIWRSDDHGDTFTEVFRIPYDGADGVRRFYGCEAYQGRLFFQPDGRGGDQFVLRYDGAVWDSLAMSGMPADRQGIFTAWGDSLIYSTSNRMYIIHGDQVTARWEPFQGNTWCRGVYKYGDAIYGGAQSGLLHRWRPETGWVQVDQLGIDPATEDIEGLTKYRGRLYVSTSRPDGYAGGRLYVSAAAASGALVSRAHDFGRPVVNGVLTWDACSPGAGNVARLQVRSSATLEQLAHESFAGPDGTPRTFYQDGPPASLPAGHNGDRFFQYRVELLCPDGLRMPWLSRVALDVDTLAVAGVADDDPWGSDADPNGSRALSLEIVAARPNPARGPIEVTLTLRDAVSAPGAATAAARVAADGSVTQTALLRIVDVQGRAVRSARLSMHAGMPTSWQWDLRDDRGLPVATGLYQLCAGIPGPSGPTARPRAVIVLR